MRLIYRLIREECNLTFRSLLRCAQLSWRLRRQGIALVSTIASPELIERITLDDEAQHRDFAIFHFARISTSARIPRLLRTPAKSGALPENKETSRRRSITRSLSCNKMLRLSEFRIEYSPASITYRRTARMLYWFVSHGTSFLRSKSDIDKSEGK